MCVRMLEWSTNSWTEEFIFNTFSSDTDGTVSCVCVCGTACQDKKFKVVLRLNGIWCHDTKSARLYTRLKSCVCVCLHIRHNRKQHLLWCVCARVRAGGLSRKAVAIFRADVRGNNHRNVTLGRNLKGIPVGRMTTLPEKTQMCVCV